MVPACIQAKEHIFLNLKYKVFLLKGWLSKYHEHVLSVATFFIGWKK